MVIPSMTLVVDDSSSETPSRVNAGSSDWNSGQVHQEDSKPNQKRSQDLQNVQQPKNTHTSATFYAKNMNQNQEYGICKHTGTWESLALLLASVAEKTV